MVVTPRKKLFAINLRLFEPRVSNNDLSILFRQIFFMLDAGISINDTIRILSDQTKNKKLGFILKEVYNNILEGQRFSYCLSKHNKYFPSLVINMLRAGEDNGTLNRISYDLANYYECRARFVSDFLRVLIYPVIVIAMLFLVLIFALMFIIPGYSQMFLYKDLPLMTKLVINLSDFFCKYYLWLALFLLTFFTVSRRLFETGLGKIFYGWFIFSSPTRVIYGPYLNFMFAQVLSMQLNSNVNIISALENAKQVINNKFLDKDFDLIVSKIKNGNKISVAVIESKKFDRLLSEMIGIGESTGNLGKIMRHCQKYFESQLLFNLKKFESLIEPALTIITGIILFVVILAVVEPNFELGNIM